MALIIDECGPPTLTTTGAVISSPPSRPTPVTRPSALWIAVTAVRSRNSQPFGRAAWARLWAASIGSSMNPLSTSRMAVSSAVASSANAGSSMRFGG